MDAIGRAMIDSRYTYIVRTIYEGATLTVRINGDLAAENITIEKSVRRGDAISPKLFGIGGYFQKHGLVPESDKHQREIICVLLATL